MAPPNYNKNPRVAFQGHNIGTEMIFTGNTGRILLRLIMLIEYDIFQGVSLDKSSGEYYLQVFIHYSVHYSSIVKMSSRELFLKRAEQEMSQSVPSLKGYYLKQLLPAKIDTDDTSKEKEAETEDFTQCRTCGVYYGPGCTQFKIRSKWKRKKEGKKRKKSACGKIEIKCLYCGTLRYKPLAKLPKKIPETREETGIHHIAKKLFTETPHAKNRATATPSHLVERLKATTTPGSVNLPIIDKPSKSARKKFRMKPKTIIGSNAEKKSQKEPDLFSFLSSI